MATTASNNGILLYSSSMYPFPTATDNSAQYSSSSSSSASSPPTPQRKIRFAPLPDPRRSVLVADDGSELPINYFHDGPCPPLLADIAVDATSSPLAITPDVDSDSQHSSSSYARGADSSATTPTASASDSVSSFTQECASPSLKATLPPIPNPLLAAKLQKHHDDAHTHSSSSKFKPKSLLRPFLRRPHSSSGAVPTLSSSQSNNSSTASASSSTSTLHPHNHNKHGPFPRINLSSPSLGLVRVGPRHPPQSHTDDGESHSKSSGGGFMGLFGGSSSSVNHHSKHHHSHHPLSHSHSLNNNNNNNNAHIYSPHSPLSQSQPLSRTSSIQSIQSNGIQTPFGSTASLPLTRTDSGRLQTFTRSNTNGSFTPGKRPSTASGGFSSSSQLSLGMQHSSLSLSAGGSRSGAGSMASPPRKGKGTRMLNGRVYGHRRGSSGGAGGGGANPFANARDEADPEFVEWGYGGMGSVRNGADGSGVWGRLQREGTVLGGEGSHGGSGGKKEGVGGGGGGGGGELDDGRWDGVG
ncbi:hypothetical protein ONZ45_g12801 [Pleurotus djamor]|nr:hypothetical protein ONZ45_g12801 [Pleurotus djamor]